MTTNEIKTLIQNTIAGQGSQVDIGGKLAEILGAIVDTVANVETSVSGIEDNLFPVLDLGELPESGIKEVDEFTEPFPLVIRVDGKLYPFINIGLDEYGIVSNNYFAGDAFRAVYGELVGGDVAEEIKYVDAIAYYKGEDRKFYIKYLETL